MKKIMIILLCILSGACSDNLEIIKGEDFTLETEPYRTSLAKGETREISFNILSESEYRGTAYRIRHYMTEGDGILELDDGRIMREGRDCLLSSKHFRIRYTAISESEHCFEIRVSDNLDHTHSIKIELSSR